MGAQLVLAGRDDPGLIGVLVGDHEERHLLEGKPEPTVA
jgi:hypothetical protein